MENEGVEEPPREAEVHEEPPTYVLLLAEEAFVTSHLAAASHRRRPFVNLVNYVGARYGSPFSSSSIVTFTVDFMGSIFVRVGDGNSNLVVEQLFF